ncbi:MAG TPA: glycosylase [Microbacterium sp.]|nr:glycosylase [Microbacterium sp.]
MRLQRHSARLDHDPSRVIARFFLPGDELTASPSRASQVVARVLGMPEHEIADTVDGVNNEFSERHPHAIETLAANARAVGSRILQENAVSDAQALVLGAAFTAEYAVEGAALCNPSAVVHPSQDDLAPGELRVALSLRGIGEGHISAIEFAEAVIGADGTWTFGDRSAETFAATISHGDWARRHFSRVLENEGHLSDPTSAVLGDLPDRFTVLELESALWSLPEQLSLRADRRVPTETLREIAATAYHADFPTDSPLSGRVLLPVTAEENNGVEDARFVLFTHPDGRTEYRATYTAYNGRDIAPRLITSDDLVGFAMHRLTGSGAVNKGMALFPRLVGGKHLALSRVDGESISLASSDDGEIWDDRGVVHRPTEMWEVIQVGNCGAPIETPDGWLVLTHGVGPLRTYCLGALLLDLDDPSRVLARTTTPLLRPEGEMRTGYVPRVVYSCGAIVHNGTLWIPVGVGDSRIRVYSIEIAALIAAMTRTDAAADVVAWRG